MRQREVLTGAMLVLAACCKGSETPGAPTKAVSAPVIEITPTPSEGTLPPLVATTWINTQPLTRASLSGKVVVVQFWTYTCINWRRTLPYVRAWWEKYASRGLVVLGVHSPEFDFEADVSNVRKAVQDMRIDFPIAVDSTHDIWDAFGNEYWPALYFVDAQGRIRHRQFGEGDYDRAEEVIQTLLSEAGAPGVGHQLVSVVGLGPELAADWADLRSSENYLGYLRTENFVSPVAATLRGISRTYAAPQAIELNHWGLAGDFTLRPESVVLDHAGGSILYRFHARDLHLVMGPGRAGTAVSFRVLLDGRPPAGAHGSDVDEAGKGLVREPRMYHLVRQPKPVVDRELRIEFLDAPASLYSFTFG